MEATETDFEYPQSEDVVDSKINDLAGGIMDMLDNTSPETGGTVESKHESEQPDQTAEPVTEQPDKEEPEKEEPTQDRYTIKWQGQEKEVTQDELFELAQKGYDYTKKTQDLAQERDNLAPYIGLANTIKARPDIANKVAELIAGKTPEQVQSFDDPIEQLKYEIEQKAASIADQKIANALQPLQRVQVLNAVRAEVQRDPDYGKIHQSIIDMVKSQPPMVQKTLYAQLDQDPQAYLEAFQHFKKNMSPEVKELPKVVKKETHAPILESGGVETPSTIESKAKIERVTKLKAKAFRTGDPSELASWLRASGAIDHLY